MTTNYRFYLCIKCGEYPIMNNKCRICNYKKPTLKLIIKLLDKCNKSKFLQINNLGKNLISYSFILNNFFNKKYSISNIVSDPENRLLLFRLLRNFLLLDEYLDIASDCSKKESLILNTIVDPPISPVNNWTHFCIIIKKNKISYNLLGIFSLEYRKCVNNKNKLKNLLCIEGLCKKNTKKFKFYFNLVKILKFLNIKSAHQICIIPKLEQYYSKIINKYYSDYYKIYKIDWMFKFNKKKYPILKILHY